MATKVRAQAAPLTIPAECNGRPVTLTLAHCPEARGAHERPSPSGVGSVAWGSALVVPPPPDYSTPAAVSARAREAGTGGLEGFRSAAADASVRKAYRELRAVAPALPCRVEDAHAPKVAAVWMVEREIRRGDRWETIRQAAPYDGTSAGAWELVPIIEAQAAPPKRRSPKGRPPVSTTPKAPAAQP